jgi:hypothetical protein
MTSVAALVAYRGFMQLWFARLAGTAAAQMLMVAVGWQMYDLTGSAWDLGLVGLLQFAPALALVLVAGHVIDRYHRARIVAGCLGLQMAVAIALCAGAAGAWTTRELLLGISVVLGAVRAFQMPAQQALTPQLVPTHVLPRALAFSSVGLQGAIIAGPALGGLIYIAGAQATYASCAMLFMGAGALCLAIRYHHAAPPREPISLRSLLAGVDYVQRNRVVLGAISLDLFAVLLGAVALYGASTLVFGLSTHFLLSLLMLGIGGAADMVSVVIRQTLVQLETPDAMRGRVSAVNSVFIGGSNQLGEFRAGAMAAWLGPVGSVVLGGVGTLMVAGLWWRLAPALAQRDALLSPSLPPAGTAAAPQA